MGETPVEIKLLGPLEVRVGDRTVSLARPMQRALLAALALDAGVCVSRGRLADALWGESQPDSAGHALQVHISSLRKSLAPSLVETCPGGYRLAVPREAVDALRAADLVAAGGHAEALALFRGEPLADVALEGAAAHEAARLAGLRLEALEHRYEERLAAGEGVALVAGLERLVAEEPLRERPRAQLMLALYRSGRQADALAAYQEARRTFVDELGIEPSALLRDLERRILQQDPDLEGQRAATAAPARRARRRLAAALAFGVVAAGAGLAGAYLLPPGHPHAAAVAATRRTPTTTVSVSTAVPRHAATPKRHVSSKPKPKPKPKPTPRRRVPAHRSNPVAVTTTRRTPHRAATTTVATRPPPTTTVHVTTPPPPVTTHPIRTTPPPATTTTATKPAGPVQITDTFDSQVVDERVWNVLVNGVGSDAVQRNGKLVISIAARAKPGGQWNFVGTQYGTKVCFTGDIDMQVDYRLVSWPASSGAYVSLSAVFANAMVERFSPTQGAPDIYGSVIDPRWASQTATGSSGSLRLRRVDGVVSTYYLDGNVWQQIDSGPAGGAAHLHIGLSMNPGLSPDSPIVAELDNFSATASGPISGC